MAPISRLLNRAVLHGSIAVSVFTILPKVCLAQPAQGNCAAVLEAAPVGNEGGKVYYGAAWGRATLADAQAGAISELVQHMNGLGINPDVGDQTGPQPGVMIVAQGCDYAHGAVVGVPWEPEDGSYNNFYSALSAATDDATSKATGYCRNRLGPGMTYSGKCLVIIQW